jgi:hypothetical protein
VIWLFGYITGYRLAMALLFIFAGCAGLIAGAQAFVSRPEERPHQDEVLAELERRSQAKALGNTGRRRR